MKRLLSIGLVAPLASLLASGCMADAPSEAVATEPSAFQGTVSNLVELTFDTEVRAPTVAEAEGLLDAQLYWMIGPSHTLGGDPRLTWAKATKTKSTTVTSPRAEAVVTFHVELPLAWPKSEPTPSTYELVLPRRLDRASQQAFFEKYKGKCISTSDADTDYSNAWYDFKPSWSSCKLEDADVVRPVAKVTPRPSTVASYPEYDRIWKDGKFQAVLVFGRDKAGSTDDSDLGAREYVKYVAGLKGDASLKNVRAKEESFRDGSTESKQTTIDADAGPGRKVHVVVFLLSKPSWSGKAFDDRYNPETREADFVAFAGHAGLGGNIQKLQSLGEYKPGQYQLFVYDGCDTYAYIDKTHFDRKRAANGAGADPEGTRDLDVILNALGAPWTHGDPSVLTLTRKLMDDAHPTKYEDILAIFPRSGAPLVVGDEDNVFKP